MPQMRLLSLIPLFVLLTTSPAETSAQVAAPALSRPPVAAPAIGIGIGAATGGLAVAAVAWAMREVAVSEWNSDACWPLGSTRYAACPGAAAAVGNSERLAIVGLSMAGAGALIAGAAAVLGVASGPQRVMVSSGPSALGASIEVTF